jgi:hypothetical protein
MNWLDYTVIIVYLIVFFRIRFYFKENKDAKDISLEGKAWDGFR